ncbi:MAG: DUF434 domain-containing protein, partial [bacterium]|nr:DUF434 domain-containing protein [bacterium]
KNDFLTGSFKDALRDYLSLIDREYPETPALKLVGDRYRLTGLQRTVLYRGIRPTEKALVREKKIDGDLKGKTLYMDGYNVIFTVMNYLLGKTVFIGNDGILRDAGETYGKIENERLFYRAVDSLFNLIREGEADPVIMYLDSPVSDSGSHRAILERRMWLSGIDGQVILAKSADTLLKEKSGGIIATSDSEIIDAVDCPIIDLARRYLETRNKTDIPDLALFK